MFWHYKTKNSTVSSLKYENKLKKIFNSFPVITDFDVHDKTLAVYWGWASSKVDVIAFDENHNEIKPIFSSII
jgi:hypothetical protein